MRKEQEIKYNFCKEIEFPTGIVRVYRPVLTDEERERRQKQLHDATANLIKAEDRANMQKAK